MAERETLWQGVCIRSYTYRSLVVGWGVMARATAVVQWSAPAARYTITTPAHQPAANAHHLLHHHLDHYINRSFNISTFFQYCPKIFHTHYL